MTQKDVSRVALGPESSGATAVETAGGHRRFVSSWFRTLLVATCYIGLAFTAYSTIWMHGWRSWMLGSGQQDPAQSAWFLGWARYAVLHARDPFFTAVVNAPYGINLLWNTSVLALGLVAIPLTQAFGPVASYNVLMTVAPAASAFSLYWVSLRMGYWWAASAVAGLIFGFGPYMVGQGHGHLHLVSVFLVPLIAYQLFRALTCERQQPFRRGALLALLVVAQFFISTEVLANAAVFSALGIGIFALSGADQRHRSLRALATFAVAGVLSVALLAYPLWFQFAGPAHLRGLTGLGVFSADALDVVVPSSNQLLHATPWIGLADRATLGVLTENGTYLGIPLVMLLIGALIGVVRNRRAAFWALLSVVAVVLSMGPVLLFAGKSTGIVMPFGLLDHLSLFQASLPARYALFADLFAGLAVAAVLTSVRTFSGFSGAWRAAGVTVLAVVIVVPLVPGAWPYPAGPIRVPSYFLATRTPALAGQTVVAYPFPTPAHDAAMLWQAQAHLRFRLVDAYALTRPVDGTHVQYQGPSSSLERALAAAYRGAPVAQTAARVRRERADLRAWGATALLAAPRGSDPAAAVGLFTLLSGRHPLRVRGVLMWPLPRLLP